MPGLEMTEAYLKQLCKEGRHTADTYTTPELNDKLYLHYKGFREIKALERYTGLKVLWLEGNGLTAIGGLSTQEKMRTLYLHENCIDKIE